MKKYQLYPLTDAGRIAAPAAIVSCCDDATAFEAALTRHDGRLIEIWSEAKRVGWVGVNKQTLSD